MPAAISSAYGLSIVLPCELAGPHSHVNDIPNTAAEAWCQANAVGYLHPQCEDAMRSQSSLTFALHVCFLS